MAPMLQGAEIHWENTVNVDIFGQLNLRASSIRRHIHLVKFYFSYYDNNFHSHQISSHLRPLRKSSFLVTYFNLELFQNKILHFQKKKLSRYMFIHFQYYHSIWNTPLDAHLMLQGAEISWENTVNVDIFAQLNFRTSSIRGHNHFVNFLRTFYLSYNDNNFHLHQISSHLKPCAKCAKICIARKDLQYHRGGRWYYVRY